jgi:hypothetical protein
MTRSNPNTFADRLRTSTTVLLAVGCAGPEPRTAAETSTAETTEASDVGSAGPGPVTSSAAASSGGDDSGDGGASVGEPTDMGPSNALPAWRDGQTPLTWRLVGTSVPMDVDPEDDPALNPNYPDLAPWRNSSGGGDIFRVWNSWSGAAWDETTGILRVHGGGHDDYAGNEVYAQRLVDDIPQWSLERPPTGAIGNTGVLDDFQELTAVYFDDRPRSNHSYDNLLAIDGEMWLAIVAAPYRAGGATGLRTFKLKAGEWETVQIGQFPAGGGGAGGAGSACHDTTRDRIYRARESMAVSSTRHDSQAWGCRATRMNRRTSWRSTERAPERARHAGGRRFRQGLGVGTPRRVSPRCAAPAGRPVLPRNEAGVDQKSKPAWACTTTASSRPLVRS